MSSSLCIFSEKSAVFIRNFVKLTYETPDAVCSSSAAETLPVSGFQANLSAETLLQKRRTGPF